MTVTFQVGHETFTTRETSNPDELQQIVNGIGQALVVKPSRMAALIDSEENKRGLIMVRGLWQPRKTLKTLPTNAHDFNEMARIISVQ